jgi:hypothetical protein
MDPAFRGTTSLNRERAQKVPEGSFSLDVGLL